MATELSTLIANSNLDEYRSKLLTEKFSEFQATADEWKAQADQIIITDESQADLMKLADEGRKILQKKRTDLEKMRKQLKEPALREGQTIDAIAKTLTAMITPIEEDLTSKAKFKEIREAARTLALKEQRMKELFPYDVSIDSGFIVSMDESTWKTFLNGVIADHETKVRLAKEKEDARILQAKLEAAEQARIREENARLRAEAIERERQAENERAKAEAERARLTFEARENERKLVEERAKAEAIQTKFKEQIAAQEAAEELSAVALANMDDKEKLAKLKENFVWISYPECSSEQGQLHVLKIKNAVKNIVDYLDSKIQLL